MEDWTEEACLTASGSFWWLGLGMKWNVRCPCDLVRNGGILNRFGQKKNEAVGKVVDLKKPRKISRTRTIEGLQAQ